MGSHSVTYHPTQLNAARHNPYKPVLDLPTPESWKAERVDLSVGYTEIV